MDRRTFLTLVGVGGIATNLPAAFAQQPSLQSTIAQNGVTDFVPIGSLDDFNKKGEFLDKKSPVGSILVVPNSEEANGLSAVNPTCTHEGCTVKWKEDKNYFDCPCHDARFTIDGSVAQGPAKEPLETYEVKVENNTIFARKNTATSAATQYEIDGDDDDDDEEEDDD